MGDIRFDRPISEHNVEKSSHDRVGLRLLIWLYLCCPQWLEEAPGRTHVLLHPRYLWRVFTIHTIYAMSPCSVLSFSQRHNLHYPPKAAPYRVLLYACTPELVGDDSKLEPHHHKHHSVTSSPRRCENRPLTQLCSP